jgi:periplasmic mercuric ion binding protein
MKSLKLYIVLFVSLFAFQFSFGQASQTETITVNGNCGMCKKNIEKSAIDAGATVATWDKKTKFLTVSYDPGVSNSEKIQTSIAQAGYDTQDVKASDSAYFKLEECCQYERKQLKAPKKN